MPIFNFKCNACGEEYEDFRNIKEKPGEGACIKCGSDRIELGDQVTASCGCGCGCSNDEIRVPVKE